MFESITKNTVIISGGLIFLGYCKYYFYFNVFGIDIYNYISTSELLLSFIPIIIIFILPLSFVFYINLFQKQRRYIRKDGKDVTMRINRSMEDRNNPSFLIRHILFTKRLKKRIRLVLIIRLLLNSAFILFAILVSLTFLFLKISLTGGSWSDVEILFYPVAAGWIFFIFEPFVFKKAMEIYPYNNYFWTIKAANYFFIVTFFIYSYQKFQAHEILSGLQNRPVTITLKSGAVVKSDSDFVYIGQTSQYMFFRNLKDSVNTIYDVSSIEKTTRSTRR